MVLEKILNIVIPAYEPDFHLLDLIDNLNNYFSNFNIIIVDDGSSDKTIFSSALDKDNVIILHHDENMGKGEALKTAFRYIKELGNKSIIVTADSDGQHKPLDIKRIYDFYLSHEGTLVLGSRKFENEVPAKSRFGNDVSRGLLRMCFNKHLNDTQTGLRAFDTSLIDFMLGIKGSRFEYEMNMLSEAVKHDVAIYELKIETIYINENKGSHFKPVKDFLKISFSIIKYRLSDILMYLFDIILFTFLAEVFRANSYALIHASYISTISTFALYLFINLCGLAYGDKKILSKKKRVLEFVFSIIIFTGINLGLTYLFNKLIANMILDRFISNLLIMLVVIFGNYFGLEKSKLNE